jgi:fucose permease
VLTQTVEGLKLGEVGNLSEFSKMVSETRNAVVHMSDNDKGQLNEAFARVNKLSLKLCFWYAVCQAYYAGVKIPNIAEFLFNNRNARHGLPNEVLEHRRRE